MIPILTPLPLLPAACTLSAPMRGSVEKPVVGYEAAAEVCVVPGVVTVLVVQVFLLPEPVQLVVVVTCAEVVALGELEPEPEPEWEGQPLNAIDWVHSETTSMRTSGTVRMLTGTMLWMDPSQQRKERV
jgi:hypothetical protein